MRTIRYSQQLQRSVTFPNQKYYLVYFFFQPKKFGFLLGICEEKPTTVYLECRVAIQSQSFVSERKDKGDELSR
jgi:hypothetical protein